MCVLKYDVKSKKHLEPDDFDAFDPANYFEHDKGHYHFDDSLHDHEDANEEQ